MLLIDDDTLLPGRVMAVFGRDYQVEMAGGGSMTCRVRRGLGRVICNDRVAWRQLGLDHGLVERIEPRRNHFSRADRYGRPRLVAANLDRIVVVVAPRPEPTRDLVDRYLVACENVGIAAAICLNKQDLVRDDEAELWHRRARLYRDLGYPVIDCQAKGEGGLERLLHLLKHGASILVGQSGVGKSTIVNRLLPNLDLRTGELSSATGKGRHTTSASTVYRMPGGGEIIDSPGVWEYGIWKMSASEIVQGFREFSAWASDCRFPDCSHTHEPGCALAGAVQAGHVSAERLAAYRRIVAGQ